MIVVSDTLMVNPRNVAYVMKMIHMEGNSVFRYMD